MLATSLTRKSWSIKLLKISLISVEGWGFRMESMAGGNDLGIVGFFCSLWVGDWV